MKPRYIIFLALLFLLTVLIAQQSLAQGIKFEHGLTWQEIKMKAKNENKLLFVDCNASWCKPCKEMEANVFPTNTIGKFFNDRFISIKVQLDTAKNDTEEIKHWYADAHSIMKEYNISSFPTFLFFSAEGKIVHKGIGFKDVDNFLTLANDACDPNRQYYTLLDKYNVNPKNVNSVAYLARLANEVGERNIGESIARKYINEMNYNEVYSKDVIEFLRQFTVDKKDRAFKIFWKNTDKINKIMGNDDYVQGFIADIILKNEIKPLLSQYKLTNKMPNWNFIFKDLKRKYDEYYANRTVCWAKVGWYSSKRNWAEYTKYLVKAVELSSADTKLNGYFVNNNAWFVFERSSDREELNSAILWMEHLFKNNKEEAENPQSIDTYANLLYKIGRIGEAIIWEQKAIEIEKEHARISLNEPDGTFEKTLSKMKGNEPTWRTK